MVIALLSATHPKTDCALQITMFLANNAISPAVATKFWTAENEDVVCVKEFGIFTQFSPCPRIVRSRVVANRVQERGSSSKQNATTRQAESNYKACIVQLQGRQSK